ncbi:MAG: hypothetical protein LBI03_07055 [Clostridiales bacterium]|nr:hypothetical protein [Clostridiales bacterium]
MKYRNAINILPEALVLEIQKYTQGELIYIPVSKNGRARWGSQSGYRKELYDRNTEIAVKYTGGMTIEDLADSYFLSQDSIKKILYKNKK